jgi:hypothetical protein
MKKSMVLATMLAVFAVPAFAGNSQTVNVPTPMKAGATQLAPGDYNVTWTGTGTDVQVTIAKNKKVIVTLQAKLVEKPNREVGLDVETQNGVDILDAIRLKNMTLVVANSPSSGN